MQTRISLLRPADFRLMSWKNGGGSTTELAIHPEDSRLSDPFHWRASLAQLSGSGPFSSFPNYDRILVQLSGQPMRLFHQGQGERQLDLLVPYHFRGDWDTRAELADGPAEDFNLMFHREQILASLDCLQLSSREFIERTATAALIFVWQGTCELQLGESSWTIAASEALRIEPGRPELLRLRGESAIVLCARFQSAPRIR